MTNDIRTALEIIKDEQSIIEAFVSTKEKALNRITIRSCTMEKSCIKCKCLWCGNEMSWLSDSIHFLSLKPMHIKLHNECYYKVIKEWIP